MDLLWGNGTELVTQAVFLGISVSFFHLIDMIYVALDIVQCSVCFCF